MLRNEDKLRDYLALNLESLPDLIRDFDQICERGETREREFFGEDHDEGGPNATALLKRIVQKRFLVGIEGLRDLELISTEFPFNFGATRGRPPSADILAMSNDLGTLFLFEVKIEITPERQAVGELSAYSHGLQSMFWGMNPSEHVWVPLSTQWSLPVRTAFVQQTIFAGRAVIPIFARNFAVERDQVSVDLEILDLEPEIDDCLAMSLFAWDSYDCMAVCLPQDAVQRRSFLEFVGATAARLGYAGFVMHAEAPAVFPYPECYLIATYNPFKGGLKRKQLQAILDMAGAVEMKKEVKRPLPAFLDLDIRNQKTFTNIPNFGLGEPRAPQEGIPEERFRASTIIFRSGNRTNLLFEELKIRIKMVTDDFELSYPLMKKGIESIAGTHLFGKVVHFGFFHEAVMERLAWEFHHRNEHGDGPEIGDLWGDPFALANSWTFMESFMRMMNYEFDSQISYEDADDDEAEEDEDQFEL